MTNNLLCPFFNYPPRPAGVNVNVNGNVNASAMVVHKQQNQQPPVPPFQPVGVPHHVGGGPAGVGAVPGPFQDQHYFQGQHQFQYGVPPSAQYGGGQPSVMMANGYGTGMG